MLLWYDHKLLYCIWKSHEVPRTADLNTLITMTCVNKPSYNDARICTLPHLNVWIMARNGPGYLNENFDPKLRRVGSAFKPVLSSKSYETTSWLRNGSLLAKRCRSPHLAEEYRIDKLEGFVENFFTRECDLKLLWSRPPCNPRSGLALPETSRTRKKITFTEFQIEALEKNYKFKKYLSPTSRSWLANLLGLSKQQVVTWFQNRRAKERKRAGVKLPRHGKKCTLVGNDVTFPTSLGEQNNLGSANRLLCGVDPALYVSPWQSPIMGDRSSASYLMLGYCSLSEATDKKNAESLR